MEIKLYDGSFLSFGVKFIFVITAIHSKYQSLSHTVPGDLHTSHVPVVLHYRLFQTQFADNEAEIKKLKFKAHK